MHCPGAIVGFKVANQPAQVVAIGVADVDTNQPMQADFNMRVASVAKPFVGTAILMLCDQGKASPDDTIEKYVAGVPLGNMITLRQLANNTSGLFNSIENKDFQKLIVAQPQRSWDADEILGFALPRESYNQPGAAWRYSNTNAVLLGKVIEKISGVAYEEFVKNAVIKPLGLSHTSFIDSNALSSPSPSGYRNGYKEKWLGYGDTWYNVTDYSSQWAGAAGNLSSTVDDLLVAAKPLATGQLLNEASRKELQAWIATTQEDTVYGFAIGKYQDWFGHAGDVPGFSSFMGYSPQRDMSLVVLTNLSNNVDGSSPALRLRDVAQKFTN